MRTIAEGRDLDRPNGIDFDEDGNLIVVISGVDKVLDLSTQGEDLDSRTLEAGPLDRLVVQGDGSSLVSSKRPAERLSAQLFSAHMVQHLVLSLVVAPLLVWGRTAMTLLWPVPSRLRRAGGTWWATGGWSGVLRPLMTHPLSIWLCGPHPRARPVPAQRVRLLVGGDRAARAAARLRGEPAVRRDRRDHQRADVRAPGDLEPRRRHPHVIPSRVWIRLPFCHKPSPSATAWRGSECAQRWLA